MHQFELVHDDIYAALRGLVSACGGSKKVGPMLWPAKGEKAASWLDDCLNPDRQAKFSLEEFFHLLRIGRERGFHAAKHFVDDETLYERSIPIDPEDQKAVLQRHFIEAVKTAKSFADQLERAEQRAATSAMLKSVRP